MKLRELISNTGIQYSCSDFYNESKLLFTELSNTLKENNRAAIDAMDKQILTFLLDFNKPEVQSILHMSCDKKFLIYYTKLVNHF